MSHHMLSKGKHLRLTTKKKWSKSQFKHHNTLCLNGLEDCLKEDMKCMMPLEISQRSAIGTSRSKIVGVEFDKEGLELPGVVNGPFIGDNGWSCAIVVGKFAFFCLSTPSSVNTEL